MNTRNKILVAFAVTMVTAAPLALAGHEGYGVESRDVVTGHTVFVSDRSFDDNIAAIAGITERKVVWFNGLTIFDTTTSGFVAAIEADTCSPEKGTDFQFVDQDMTFIDPNGQHHVVTHYTFRCGDVPPQPLANLVTLANNSDLEEGIDDSGPLDFRNDVWVTYNHAKIDDPTVMDTYNFALAVETDLFGQRDDTTNPKNPAGPCTSEDAEFCHDGDGGSNEDEIKDGDSNFNGTKHTPDPDGSEFNSPHEHNVAEVDLFFSKDDWGDGQSTGCADENNPATPDVNETAEGDECRAALGCGGTPLYDPDPTTPEIETFAPDEPPCTDSADTAP